MSKLAQEIDPVQISISKHDIERGVNKPFYLLPILENIPEELSCLPAWTYWGGTKKHGDDKWGKVPKQFNQTGANWYGDCPTTTLDQLPPVWQDPAHRDCVDGLDFRLTDDRRIVVLDPDNSIFCDTMKLKKWAQDLVEIGETYTEFSPTGTGVKLFFSVDFEEMIRSTEFKGLSPDDIGLLCKSHYLEAHDITAECLVTDRWATVTGHRLPGTPASLNTDINTFREAWLFCFEQTLDSTLEAIRLRKLNTVRLQEQYSGELPPFHVILDSARKAANGEKFKKLFDRGDDSDYGGDQSKADLALTSMLAYWCGPRREVISELFSTSSLMRKKWKGSYERSTLDAAIGDVRDVHDWGHYWRSEEQKELAEAAVIMKEHFTGSDNFILNLDDQEGVKSHPARDDAYFDAAREQREAIIEPEVKVKNKLQRWDELCMIADNQHEDWAIKGWLEFGCLHLFTGLPFSGKSTITAEVIASIVKDRDWFGFETQQVPIVLFDLENKERILVKRIRSALAGDPGDIQDLLFRADPVTVTKPLDNVAVLTVMKAVSDQMNEVGAKGILIIDTFRTAFSGSKDYDEVDPGKMVALLEPLKSLAAATNWAVLVLHHNAKASNTYSGSTAIAGVADYMWNWQSNKETLEATLALEGRCDPIEALAFRYNVNNSRNEMIGIVSEVRKDEARKKHDLATVKLLGTFPREEEEAIPADEAAKKSTLALSTFRKQTKQAHDDGYLSRSGTGSKGDGHKYWLSSKGLSHITVVSVEATQGFFS